MACKTSYELHHNFPKLAEEAGFTYNTHRPRIHIDWNKIRLVDVESLIRDRKFVLIEQHMNDILDCVLESEFDVRILDEGVVKMFRLAQLAVEYQQFCRHYLDRSVYVLREEIASLVQELDAAKKDLREKEEEIRKLKRKSKHTYRAPLPYGNDNIATMILKTLNNKSDIFPSNSNGDILRYNKCSYCDKAFLNQLYLKSHVSRRHTNVVEIPQKDGAHNFQDNLSNNDHTNLNEEIMELKHKLKEMENIITNVNNQAITIITEDKNIIKNEDKIYNTISKETKNNEISREMKDAEISANNEDYLFEKLEEWKKEEHEKYNKEINLLRTQIFETISSFREKEKNDHSKSESNIIEQLHTTINEQGAEILALKQELTNSKIKAEQEDNIRKKETYSQITFWTKRAEGLSKQYESLLQKLDEVAKEAQDSRVLAEVERTRATQLQNLLQHSLNKTSENDETVTNPSMNLAKADDTINMSKKNSHKSHPTKDRKSLEDLHRKAQELLNMGSISSSVSSNIDLTHIKSFNQERVSNNKQPKKVTENNKIITKTKNVQDNDEPVLKNTEKTNHLQSSKKDDSHILKFKKRKLKKENSQSHVNIKETNGPIFRHGSPIKIVRAKITEEVNTRLALVGVDPLKCRLPHNIFQKRRQQLQHQLEFKSKKNPTYEKVRHSVLTYLDANTTNMKKEVDQIQEYTSPNKITKAFSLTSVISNVKNKALSLVKSNDINSKVERKAINSKVAKKAMFLLKTPPGSASSSPANERHSPVETNMYKEKLKSKENAKSTLQIVNKNKKRNLRKSTQLSNEISDSDSNLSDHKYYNTTISGQISKSIENLIKSPARRPISANPDFNHTFSKYTIHDKNSQIVLAQSPNVSEIKQEANTMQNTVVESNENSSNDVESLAESPIRKTTSEEYIRNSPKQTKGVLKNASSISSLNKKKVLFDMDAIQMKSLSASPSQSITEKIAVNEKYELGLIHLDDEEWDISSIDNEPLKINTKIQVNSRTSPKIAELKKTIESQLARRNDTPSTTLVGGVDVLRGPTVKPASIGGSNTSLGSSIFDDSESVPALNHKTFVKSKNVTEKNDSDVDISEFSVDKITHKNENESF